MNQRPYVVSADIELLLRNWANQMHLTLPSHDFFQSLRQKFCLHMSSIFPDFEFIEEKELIEGLSRLLEKNRLPVISLDHNYFISSYNLDVSRVIDDQCNEQGWGARDGVPLDQQMRYLAEQVLSYHVALVDDVIFSGHQMERVGQELRKYGICVSHIYAGVGIGRGIRHLHSLGYEVQCVRAYDQVIDEVCERDFYPGIPFSGRLLWGDGNIGAPYLLPFGKPEQWASIPPQHVPSFSRFCLHQTVSLFEEIERCSGKKISCQELPRKVVGLPTDKTRYVDVLRAMLL